MMSQPKIFISYSHDDEQEKETLLQHLQVLQGSGLVDVWSDDKIRGGADWRAEIRASMEEARIAILLISVNFLNSDFIRNQEVPKLLQRHGTGDLETFPVIAKACAWRHVDWLRKMNARPKNGQPVWRDEGRHVDEELAAIVDEIAEILAETRTRPAPVVDPVLAEVLEACIGRNLGIDPSLTPAATILKQAFLASPLDLDRIRQTLRSVADEPASSARVLQLLREPALQRLARRTDQREAYEQLIFDNR